jgi:hypothetical protein
MRKTLLIIGWLVVFAVTAYDIHWAIKYRATLQMWESNLVMRWVVVHLGIITASVTNFEAASVIGYGVEAFDWESGKFHGDVEFVYVVKRNQWVEVRIPSWGEDLPCTLENTSIIQVVDINKFKVSETLTPPVV